MKNETIEKVTSVVKELNTICGVEKYKVLEDKFGNLNTIKVEIHLKCDNIDGVRVLEIFEEYNIPKRYVDLFTEFDDLVLSFIIVET